MKKLRFFMILIIWFVLTQPVYALTIVNFSPELTDPSTGKFNIDVEMGKDGTGKDEELGGFQFDLIYDPAVITVDSIILGDFLGKTGRTLWKLLPENDSFRGILTFGAFTYLPGDDAVKGPVGNGTLATVTFSVKNQNDGNLSFDLNRSWVLNTAGDAVPAQWGNGLITPTCKITVIPPNNGTITPSGEVIVKKGSDQTFIIIPSDCYHIVSVSADGNPVGAVTTYTFVNVIEDQTLAADFAVNTYTITPAVSGTGGNISPSTPVTVTCGGNQTFVLTPQNTFPDQCYNISTLSVDSVPVTLATASYTFDNVRSDHTVTAGFALNNYIITPEAEPGGSISPSVPVTLICGSQKFDIMPDTQNGYQISYVIADDVSVGAVSSYTFDADKLTGSNHSIKAVFVPPEFHIIRADAGTGGTISPAGEVKVGHGQDQTFEIKPADCFRIKEVLADGVSQGAVISYTFKNVTADHHQIHADFEKNTYIIKAVTNEGGTITPSGDVKAECGQDICFTVKPDECHYIADVKIDGISVGVKESYCFAGLKKDHKIEAVFAVKNYTVTATAEGSGSISPSGSITVACGEGITFSIVPNDEKHPVSDVRVNGESKGMISTYTFKNVKENFNRIHAVFAQVVNIIAEKNGTVAPSGEITVPHGENQRITITPDDCQRLGEIAKDGNPVTADVGADDTGTQFYNLNVTDDHDIKFAFERTVIAGDIDNNGKADLRDAVLTMQILSGQPNTKVTVCADVNGDGKIGTEEVIYILKTLSPDKQN